jgi:hypothetical protein
MDRIGREPHHRYADYFVGTAAELEAGDGCRLLPPVPAALGAPLVVTAVETLDERTLAVSVIDRHSMVDEALGNLPPGVAEVVETVVLSRSNVVLIRY